MLSYCLMCNKIQKAKTQEVEKIKPRKKVKPVLLSSSLVCGSEKIKFIKKQETKCLLSMICKISLIDPLLI